MFKILLHANIYFGGEKRMQRGINNGTNVCVCKRLLRRYAERQTQLA